MHVSGPAYLRLLAICTGCMNLAVWCVAFAGVALWGPRLLLWASLVFLLWAMFIGGPLALLAWLVGHDSGEGW